MKVRCELRMLFLLLLATCLTACQSATTKEFVRIDGSSTERVQQTYAQMLASLPQAKQVRLMKSVIALNFAGVSSAKQVVGNYELEHPGPEYIRDRIAGKTADEIIELADRTSKVHVH